MTTRKRTLRRAEDRAQQKLAKQLETLAAHEPGGAPERPIVLSSASEVEVTATAKPCAICRSAVRVEEHAAQTVGGVPLRIARVVCTFCRARRDIYFQLAGSLKN
jgi:hypothetical protein